MSCGNAGCAVSGGKRWASDEHIVSLESSKVVRVRDVRPENDENSYDAQLLARVCGSPSNPSAVCEGDGILREVPRAPVERPMEARTTPTARQVMIRKAYLDRFGYTKGCPKCQSIFRGEESLKVAGHSQQCRARIEERMQNDENLSEKLKAAQDRRDQFLAREVERGSRQQASEPVVLEPSGVVEEPAVVPDDYLIPEIRVDEEVKLKLLC